MACWPNHVTNPASRSTFQVLGRWKLTYRARRPALTQSGAALRDLSPTTMFSMPHSTADRRLRLTRQALLAAAVVPLLAGCALVMHKPHSAGSSNPWDDSAHPLTDDQAMAQVVEPAKQIVAAADLQAAERDSRSPRVTTKAIRLIRAPSGWPFCCRAITTRTFSTSVPPCCRTAGSTAPTGTVLPRHNPAQERSDREHELSVGPQLRRDDP